MPVTFVLTTPLTVGTIGNSITLESLQLTGFDISTTPQLAPLGAGTLEVTLTDPVSGFQETINYADASVLALWQSIGDAIAQAVFAKLVADGKLPAGTVTTAATASGS